MGPKFITESAGNGCWSGARRGARAAARTRDESGQSLVVVLIAMGLIVALAAFSIDVGQWYVARHQAQVVADSAALAAANCLASTKCTQTTSSGDAATIAGQYGANSVKITAVTFTGSTVKVTTQKTSASSFAGLFGMQTTNSSASATASYSTASGQTWNCASTGSTSCISLFAGNPLCASNRPTNVGLDLVINDSGGGSAAMSDAYTNGYYYNGASAGAYTVSGPSCSGDYEKQASNTTFTTLTGTKPYPAVWSKPTCSAANSATSWTTAAITSPGVYCVTTTPSGGCVNNGTGSGFINVTLSSLPSGAYEFVGPCVVLSGSSTNVTNIKGQPLVYGTSNITTLATSGALPTCALNDGSNGTSTWLNGNGASLDAAIYDQCGTFEETGNGFTGFVEAWNIVVDKNNAVTGDGPTSLSSSSVTAIPGSDALVS